MKIIDDVFYLLAMGLYYESVFFAKNGIAFS